MKQKTIEAMATKDAADWAAAQMFYGEGAGNRRKLLEAAIMTKEVEHGTPYIEAFNKAYVSQNMAEHATKAVAERARLDKAATRSKNLSALKTGNVRRMTTGFAIVYVGAIVAHRTGYDKVIWAQTKRLGKKAKDELNFRRHKATVTNIYTQIVDPPNEDDAREG